MRTSHGPCRPPDPSLASRAGKTARNTSRLSGSSGAGLTRELREHPGPAIQGIGELRTAAVSTDPIAVRLNETFAIFKRTLPVPIRCNKLFSPHTLAIAVSAPGNSPRGLRDCEEVDHNWARARRCSMVESQRAGMPREIVGDPRERQARRFADRLHRRRLIEPDFENDGAP